MSLDDPRDDVLAHVVGTIGIIGSLLALRAIFRIDAVQESEAFAGEQQRGIKPPERRSVLVENRKLNGVPLREIPGLREMGVTVSRVRSVGAIEVQRASAEIPLHVGDVVVAVGQPDGLLQFTSLVGRVSDDDLMKSPRTVTYRRVVVTRKAALGKTIAELGLRQLYGVTVTRISRGDLGMTAVPDLRLRFGDVLHIVGEPDDLAEASKVAGALSKH